MAFYAWTATDAAGKTQRGTLQAEGQKQVRQMLREQKLMPVSINETREAASAGKAKTGAKLSTPVLSMFTRHAGQRGAAAGERAQSDFQTDGRQKAGGDGG